MPSGPFCKRTALAAMSLVSTANLNCRLKSGADNTDAELRMAFSLSNAFSQLLDHSFELCPLPEQLHVSVAL